MRALLRLAGAAVLVGALMACGGSGADDPGRGNQDAPIGSTDTTPAAITNMPDGYPNVAFKCAGSTGVYAMKREQIPIILVPNDANCAGGQR